HQLLVERWKVPLQQFCLGGVLDSRIAPHQSQLTRVAQKIVIRPLRLYSELILCAIPAAQFDLVLRFFRNFDCDRHDAGLRITHVGNEFDGAEELKTENSSSRLDDFPGRE